MKIASKTIREQAAAADPAQRPSLLDRAASVVDQKL